jgi:hypothetical protein
MATMPSNDARTAASTFAGYLKPETVTRRKRIAVQIEKLVAVESLLEPWQASFVNKLAMRREGQCAPREQDVLEDLVSHY